MNVKGIGGLIAYCAVIVAIVVGCFFAGKGIHAELGQARATRRYRLSLLIGQLPLVTEIEGHYVVASNGGCIFVYRHEPGSRDRVVATGCGSVLVTEVNR